VIVGVQATAARMSQEIVAAQDMIARFTRWQGREPASVAADATYGNGEFLHWLMERRITHICARGTALCARTARSTVPSVSRIFPTATATSAPPDNNSTTADALLGTVPMSASGRANVAVGARKKRNAPAHR
jgi:hypothetical protein